MKTVKFDEKQFVLVPDYRGYAHLGTGQYVINHSSDDPAELVISIASDKDKAGRTVGEGRDNPDGHQIQPEDMCVRIRFASVAGLDALEDQLSQLRSIHFAAAPQPPSVKESLTTDEPSNSGEFDRIKPTMETARKVIAEHREVLEALHRGDTSPEQAAERLKNFPRPQVELTDAELLGKFDALLRKHVGFPWSPFNISACKAAIAADRAKNAPSLPNGSNCTKSQTELTDADRYRWIVMNPKRFFGPNHPMLGDPTPSDLLKAGRGNAFTQAINAAIAADRAKNGRA